MYIDLFELPLKLNGTNFYVQFEPEEQHYRIEFIDNSKPMLIVKDDNGKWIDLENRRQSLAEEIGKFIVASDGRRVYS